MNKAILLSVLSVVIIAGCTQASNIIPFISGGTTIFTGTGLTIESFTADSEIYGGSTARFVIEIVNNGGSKVNESSGLVMLIGPGLKLDGASTESTMYWTKPTETQYKFFGKTMKPADPVRETDPDRKTISWSLKAPSIDTGQTRTDLFSARVYYDYSTKVSGNVWVYSQTEADAAKAAGRTLNPASFQSTSGPVAIIVKVSPNPTVLYDNENTFLLNIKLQSVGGGALYKQGSVIYGSVPNITLTEDELNRLDLTIDSEGFTSDSLSDCEGIQELVAGKDTTVTCDVILVNPVSTFEGIPLTITADYGYYTERTAMVNIAGR